MFKIKLSNDKFFYCGRNTTIFEAAKLNNTILEHNCLAALCRSCVLKVTKGKTQDIQKDLFWKPKFSNLNLKYIPVLSREKSDWNGETGYVQDIVLKNKIDLENSQVYACESLNMIESSKEIFLKNNLNKNNFFSDAFVDTN